MLALQMEVKPFGIHTTIVNPGFFRTELLTEESTSYADYLIEDYRERREQQMKFWKGANSQQSGDSAKLAQALLQIAYREQPLLCFIAEEEAITTAEQVAATLQQPLNADRELSSSLAYLNG
jgi:NAD(P)-dependent dehydrogenase (short-subunit alcohol dehydrogenase family)